MVQSDWGAMLLGRSPARHAAGDTGDLAGLRVSRAAGALALVLIVYLPLEPAVLGVLPGPAYWTARLLPDGLIMLLVAATLWLDRRDQCTPDRLMLAIGAVAIWITVFTVIRGQSASDAINSVRVLIRYPLLGLVLWRWSAALPLVPLRVIQAILVAGAIQAAIGLASVALTTLDTGSLADSYLLAGSVGRYDRYGPLLTATVVAMMAWAMESGWRAWFWPLLLTTMPLVYLSTSRQAMIGLALACGIAAILPVVTSRMRALACTIAIVAGAMILFTPTTIAARADNGGDDPGGGPAAAATEPPGASNPRASALPGNEKPTVKGGAALSAEPKRNFRLFLLLSVAPWALAQEPLVGFGPGQHVAKDPDPRLEEFMARSNVEWSAAAGYMNDSQYTSLAIQFGLPVTAAFLALLLGSLLVAARLALTTTLAVARYSLMFCLVGLAAAFLGPFFEARTDSILLWIPLLVTVGIRHPVHKISRRLGATGADEQPASVPHPSC
jgi:hypothetical protein